MAKYCQRIHKRLVTVAVSGEGNWVSQGQGWRKTLKIHFKNLLGPLAGSVRRAVWLLISGL